MRKIKNILTKWIMILRETIESKYKINNASECYVVLGFPRSGTSLLSKLLAEGCGIYFGENDNLREANHNNPKGFYENKEFALINKNLKRQSISEKKPGSSGYLNGLRRFLTCIKMKGVVNRMSKHPKWGIKAAPFPNLFFYFWGRYIQKIRVVAIFREPLAVAHSNIKIKNNRDRYEDVLTEWVAVNKEIIYYVMSNDGILIEYNDLLDSQKLHSILAKVGKFTGSEPNVKCAEEIVTQKLNRSSRKVKDLKENYPLDQEVCNVLEALRKIKTS